MSLDDTIKASQKHMLNSDKQTISLLTIFCIILYGINTGL